MLTPWLKPEKLNGGMGVPSQLKGLAYGTDTLDKRDSKDSSYAQAVQVADAAKDVANTILNAAGIHSPYFVIGEVKESKNGSEWINRLWDENSKAVLGVVRAVQDITGGKVTQPGVIIDCLGDIDVDISVDFTSRPIFYQSSTVIDSRMRKPIRIRAVVAVSNYRSDNLLESAANIAKQVDPSGAAEWATNELLYGGATRAQYALYRLRWLMENGKPFTVYTPHGYYTNMLIKSLKPKTTAESLDMLLCEIIYEEAILTAPYLGKDDLKQRTPTRKNVLSGNWSTKFMQKVNNFFYNPIAGVASVLGL